MYKLNITNEDLVNIDIEDINKYIKHIEKLTNIKWKIIPDYEDYIISEYGDIISIKSKKILKPSLDKNKYYIISLSKNNIGKLFRIHRLVYNIFIDKGINSKNQIFFKDNNKSNCHYSNLSLEFILPKNLIDSKSILCNNNYNNNNDIITEISKPIEYEDLKKIVDKYKADNITNFIKNLQKDTKLEWRIIPDYKNYIISEYGDIINLKFKRILKSSLSKGYYRINLSKNNIHKDFKTHQLIYSAFIDKNIKFEDKIYFKDNNRSNIHYTNLSLEFILPKNLIDLNPILYNDTYNNTITNIPKLIEYEDLKKIVDKYKSDNITNFIKNLQKDTKLEWRIIPDYKNYIISEYGDIINLESRDILKPYINKFGYYTISLYKNTIKKTFFIHRLVYNTFINNKDIKNFDIHHKDENKSNNHYSNLQKITKSNHKKYHHNQGSEERLNQYKKYYNSKYKENLSTEEIAKKYNVSKKVINYGIQQYKIYLSDNEDMDKYNSSNIKEKQDFYSNVILKENRKEYLKEYLEKAEEIYNKKNKEHLTCKQLAKIYNLPKHIIGLMIQDIKIYIYILNKNFNEYYKLTKKQKEKLRNKITIIKRKEYVKEYLKKAEQFYNKKNKENLSYKQLAKIYNTSESTIARYIQEIKFYIFLLGRDFDKFYNLSGKEKLKLRKKIVTIDKQNNNILDIGKQIEDFKLSGISNKDIAKKLNLSINRISDIYKKYKKLINDKEIKDELKSIKNYNK